MGSISPGVLNKVGLFLKLWTGGYFLQMLYLAKGIHHGFMQV